MISSLEANKFADPPTAIGCYKPSYEMHLGGEQQFADCYWLSSVVIDFEGAWAQKWGQSTRGIRDRFPFDAKKMRQRSLVGPFFSLNPVPATRCVIGKTFTTPRFGPTSDLPTNSLGTRQKALTERLGYSTYSHRLTHGAARFELRPRRYRRRKAAAHKDEEAGTDLKMQTNPHRSAQKCHAETSRL
jgi:hypothetical protein